MSNVFTDTSALSNIVQEAFDRTAYFALRAELYFDQVATVRATNQAMPGSPVTFTKYADLSEASSPLSETVDPNAVALSTSQVQVILQEYGNAVLTTAKLRALAFLDVDMDAANIIGYNAGISTDTIAREALALGTNVAYGQGGTTTPGSRGAVEAEDTFVGNNVRQVVAQLRTANVPTLGAGMYVGMIHPNVSYDFRSATGPSNWRDPHIYVDTENIYNGEIGAYEGVRFLETPRTKIYTGSGSGAINVYATHVVGFQALAKAVSNAGGYGETPVIVRGPVTDKLERFQPMGWKHLVGYKVFREESVRRIESSSSLG
jgi:N4-gp56 family major capsid protein